MLRNLALVVVAFSLSVVEASEYGTADEAKAMRPLRRLRRTRRKRWTCKGEGAFKDRDLYVLCANASDGIITASPTARMDS